MIMISNIIIKQTTKMAQLSDYEKIVEQIMAMPVVPLVLKYEEKEQIAVLFHHKCTSNKLNTLASESFKQFNCRECYGRALHFGALSSMTGPVFMNSQTLKEIMINAGNDKQRYETMNECAIAVSNDPIDDIRIVRTNLVCNYPKFEGSSNFGKNWQHWTLTVAEENQTSKSINRKKLDLIESAFHRYLPSLLPEMVIKLAGDGTPENIQAAIDSLILMEKCLHKAPYGDHWLAPLRWISKMFEDLKTNKINILKMQQREKWAFFAQHLLYSPISEDLQGAVCTFYHTVNRNIIDLLGSAYNEDAMIKMITERLSPENHLRRDPNADLSENEIKIAMNQLGDFTNTMMTLDEAASQPHAIVLNVKEKSSLDDFKQLIDVTKKDKDMNAPANFAARSGNSAAVLEIKDIKTFEQLFGYLIKNPNTKLEVNTETLTPCYMAKTTLKEEALAHPHLWLFLNGDKASKLSLGTWATVNTIVPMYKYIKNHRNFVFFMNETKIVGNVPNCNLPVYLSSKYTRVCGKAYERLNTLSNITVPVGQVAIGMGSSIKDEANNLFQPIKLRINDTVISIDKA
jgi:hypothetical protein